MKATLYLELTCVGSQKQANVVTRHFVKDVEVDGALAIVDEIQLVNDLMEKPYVVKVSQAKVRRLVLDGSPKLFLMWPDIDFLDGNTDELFRSGWGETNYRWTDHLQNRVGKSTKTVCLG